MKVNLIILQLSHADSFDIFDKASLSFNQSEIGLRVLHKINIVMTKQRESPCSITSSISGFPRMSRYRDFPRMPRYM